MRGDQPSTQATNRSQNGGEVLGDQVMASAVLDRILHHCVVINIRGDSYRLKDRKKNALPMEIRGEKKE